MNPMRIASMSILIATSTTLAVSVAPANATPHRPATTELPPLGPARPDSSTTAYPDRPQTMVATIARSARPVSRPTPVDYDDSKPPGLNDAIDTVGNQFGLATGLGTLVGTVLGGAIGCVAGAVLVGAGTALMPPIFLPGVAGGCLAGAAAGVSLGAGAGLVLMGVPVGVAGVVEAYNMLHPANPKPTGQPVRVAAVRGKAVR